MKRLEEPKRSIKKGPISRKLISYSFTFRQRSHSSEMLVVFTARNDENDISITLHN